MYLIIIILVIILIIAFSFIDTLNNINKTELTVEESKSSIEIALIKRYDTLTESVKCAKEYANMETNLILEVTKARKGMSIKEIEKVSEQQKKAVESINAVAENYPNLKSDTLYQTIQKQLSEENEWLAAAKRVYNSNVKQYNLLIVNFPSSIVASMRGKSKMEFIHEDVTDKKNLRLF